LLFKVKPISLIEFGSGRSTFYLAEYALKNNAKFISIEQNKNYVKSVFAKAGSASGAGRYLLLETDNYATWTYTGYVIFDLVEGTVHGGSGAVYANNDYFIESAGNGWYRCGIIMRCKNTATTTTEIQNSDGSINTQFAGDGSSGIYIWGAQVEEGAFPTSYIPTSGSAITRQADNASMTGDAFSEWYSPDAGSLYAEVLREDIPGSGGNGYAGVAHFYSPSTWGHSLYINEASSPYARFMTRSASAVSDNTDLGNVLTAGQLGKIAAAYDYTNGEQVVAGEGQVSSSVVPVYVSDINAFWISKYVSGGSDAGNQYLNGHIKRLAYWPKRLANDTLKEITSLKSKIPAAGAGGKGGGLIPSAIAEAADAKSGNHYLTDTSSAGFTMQLPSGAKGASLKFTDATGSWATNQLTISPASGQKINGYSTDEDLVCDVANGWVELSWDDVNNLWVVNTLAAPVVPKNRWQKKVLSVDVTTNTTITDLGFSNLEVGKHYEIKLNLNITAEISDSSVAVSINHDGNILTEVGIGNGATAATDKPQAGRAGVSFVFKATASTLTFVSASISAGSSAHFFKSSYSCRNFLLFLSCSAVR